jgi:hypothetical protein
MGVIDEVFKIVFARYRRRFGEAQRGAAWSRACYELTGYLSWSVGGATFLGLFVVANVIPRELPFDHRRWGMILAGAAILGLGLSLNRRFAPYREQPPVLAAAELPLERWLVWRFRALSLAVFALPPISALVCRHFGIGEF